MKQIHLKFRWLEIYVRIGHRNDSARFDFKLYRVAPRQRMSVMRQDLVERLAANFRSTTGKT